LQHCVALPVGQALAPAIRNHTARLLDRRAGSIHDSRFTLFLLE